MKTLRFVRWAVCFTTAVAFLAGCSAAGTSPSLGGSSIVPPDAHVSQLSKIFAMTNVMHQGLPAVKGHVAHSWMKRVPKGTLLLYASDGSYLTVDVYTYPAGTLYGQVTGFSGPGGLCSDKHGNVYVVDYSGKVYEIQAGSTSVINSWSVSGSPIGCSVSHKGDLAVSSFYPGSVEVFPGGGPTGKTYAGPAYDWAPGYDQKGNLFVECAYASPCSSPSLFELPAGGSSWQQITLSGATIGFGAGVELMGKSIGVGDQEPGQYALGIYTGTLSGTTFTVSTKTIDSGPSSNPYTDAESWANVSKNPNGLQTKKVKDTVFSNLFSSGYEFGIWKFPAGGPPIGGFGPYNSAYTAGQTLIKT